MRQSAHRSAPLERMLTPPQVAHRLGVKVERVRNWIRSGELQAVDLASRSSTRPRFRVDPVALALFEQRRRVGTEPVPSRARTRSPEIIEFF